MDIAGVREAVHKQPFEPFSLRLADGCAVAVPHPDFVAIHPRRIIVVNEDASWSVVEPLLIVSIDYGAPRKRGTNGAGRGKKPPKRQN
jgi:hypothetical protein